MRKYTTAPHPYALLPPTGGNIEKGQLLKLELRLFGRTNEHAALVVRAIERAAWQGIGPDRISFEPAGTFESRVQCIEAAPEQLPPVPETITISLASPLRLRVRGRTPGPDALEFGDFFSVLLRRISMLCTFHEQTPFETDFKGLVDAARSTEWDDRSLIWRDLKRRSSRQGRLIDIGGIGGTMRLGARKAEPFWPWLWLGQYTLTGRACVMGHGQYTIQGHEPEPFSAENEAS